MTIEHLGFIRTDLPALKQWCRDQQPTECPSLSSYAPGRFEKWFEYEFKLSSTVEVMPAPHNERIYQLGQRLFPENHCCLFLHYPPGVGILPHRDHTASLAWVVSVNIGARVISDMEMRYIIWMMGKWWDSIQKYLTHLTLWHQNGGLCPGDKSNQNIFTNNKSYSKCLHR